MSKGPKIVNLSSPMHNVFPEISSLLPIQCSLSLYLTKLRVSQNLDLWQSRKSDLTYRSVKFGHFVYERVHTYLNHKMGVSWNFLRTGTWAMKKAQRLEVICFEILFCCYISTEQYKIYSQGFWDWYSMFKNI